MINKILKFSLGFSILFFTALSANAQQNNTVTPKKEDTLVTTVKRDDIVKWLKDKITPGTDVRNKFIADILQNALFNEMYMQRSSLGDNGRLLIVPLKKSYFSQHISKSGPMPFQNLIININKVNSIDEISIIFLSFVYPADSKLKNLPHNTFTNFYRQYEALDGTYTSISIILADSKYVETDIKNGERVQYRNWQTEKANNTSENYREWYLKTTDIIKEPDGKLNLKTKSEKLGVSNTVSPPKFKGDLRTKEYDN